MKTRAQCVCVSALAGALLLAGQERLPFPHLPGTSRAEVAARSGTDEEALPLSVGRLGPVRAASPDRYDGAPRLPRSLVNREPFGALSAATMLANLEALTSIGRSGFWRNSGSRGEREAFEFLAARVEALGTLRARGATVERTGFRLPLAAELWEASLRIEVGDSVRDVTAGALTGNREDVVRALRFDSDGDLNDTDRDPVVVSGPVSVVRSRAALDAVPAGGLAGSVAFVDFALFDRGVVTSDQASAAATTLLATRPASLVLLTRYSNTRGVSHGTFLGDVSAFALLSQPAPVPTVSVKFEDLAAAGIEDWEGVSSIRQAQVRWDADILAPGSSQYLCLTIPGEDRSRAVILGAHLDSPNTPGALDDGSGSVVLLEVARALDVSRTTPASDVVLCWFGSHERGLYGSSNFVLAHQDLLDRAIAMLEIDCLTHPLDGIDAVQVLMGQSYAAFGDARLLFQSALQQTAAGHGAAAYPWAVTGVVSDNSTFGPFAVPNSDLIFSSDEMVETHVDGHLHDPYDDMPLARLHDRELGDMARVALSAVLDLGAAQPDLRVTPPPARRAVFVASHTEHAAMTPAYQTMAAMALAWEGFDVDVVPYGRSLGPDDIADADLVVALPVLDFPNEITGAGTYDEQWSEDEVTALEDYVRRGGLLVMPNSAYRLVSGIAPYDANEDWSDANALASVFGVTFLDRRVAGATATVVGTHTLTQGVGSLTLASGNGVAFQAPGARVLAQVGGDPAVALVQHGPAGGEVLVLADHRILGGSSDSSPNIAFFRNLARYAGGR
ncbi:MAG: M28 family peptidase [Acidobacteriota bacterium]